MTYEKGADAERELVNKLWDWGYAVTRIPKSGGATERPLPDVFAAIPGVIIAIEVKATKETVKYIPLSKIEELYEFSNRCGALSLLAVKFIRKGWRISAPEDLQRTEKGAYKFRLEDGGPLDLLKPGGE